jgi:SSS family solute:Na+ symporter
MGCLLGLVGAALLAFYRLRPELVPDHLTVAQSGDAFFPHYVGHFLPAGISGLMVACILASAMSCLAAGLNATVTVISRDFLLARENRTGSSEASRVRDSRLLTLLLGVVVIAAGIGVGAVRGNLVEMSSKTVNLLFAPIFGLFFLAMFVRFATPFGAIVGALYSSTSAALVGFWDVFTGRPPVSFLLIVIVSLAVSLLAGTGFSLLPTRGRGWPAIAAWAFVCLAPLAAGVGWLISWGIRGA